MALLYPPGERTALAFKAREYSYQDLHAAIAARADLIGRLNATKIAIFSENRPEWIHTLYAGWHHRITVVPIDAMSTADEVAFILSDCRPDAVFCSANTHKVLTRATEVLDESPTILVFEELAADDSAPGFSFSEPGSDHLAVIIYTSGTTGKPKGVMLTVNNLESNRRYVERHGLVRPESRILALLPFHHSYPLQGCILAPLSVGAMTAIVDQLSADVIIDTLQRYRITLFVGVPRLYKQLHTGIMRRIKANPVAHLLFRLAARVNSITFSRIVFRSVQRRFGGHVELFISGGARLEPEINADFRHLGFVTLEGYGLTETSPMTTYTPSDRVKIGSVGVAIDDVEVRIEDDEVLIRGPNVMRGYYRQPEATAAVVKNGWFHSGDLGRIDDDGYLYITGRKKEIIVLDSGKNINPEEIEDKITACFPLALEVGVYQSGQQLAAIIVPNLEAVRREGIVNVAETIRWAVIDAYNQQANPHKRILGFTLRSAELPRTRLGKLRRFVLPGLAAARERPASTPADPPGPEYALLKRYLEETRARQVGADDHLELDLGLDSLDRIELLVFLERTFGVKIDEPALAEYNTPRRLADVIAVRKTHITDGACEWQEILATDVPLVLPRRRILLTVCRWIVRPLSRFCLQTEVKGLERLPRSGAFIIAPNHQSVIDGPLIITHLPAKVLKNTFFFAKDKHFKSWPRRQCAASAGVIVMNLNRDLKESVQKIAAVLRGGKNMVIFPEGTRSRDGKMLPFKKAFAILSRELDIPVVPVAICGSFDALPPGARIPRRTRVRLEFLNPVLPGKRDPAAIVEDVRQAIRETI